MNHLPSLRLLGVLGAFALLSPRPVPSDHGDTPLLGMLGRQDANITDLYVFTRGDRFVITLCTNPAIPPGVTEYLFPADLKLQVYIDNDSEVDFSDPTFNSIYGGRVSDPDKIQPDLTFTVTFDDQGEPQLQVSGMPGPARSDIDLFAGLRDDPFIRGPRIGRNVAAVVMEMPLADVLGDGSTILVWSTSEIPGIPGPSVDLAGRCLRSMMPENTLLNYERPKDHLRRLGLVPDVVIFDTARLALFPNGRALADDIVDMVGDSRILVNDFPFPSENDVPFLAAFPYLAPPQ